MRRPRKIWILVACSLLGIVIAICGYAFVRKSVPAQFTAKLTQVGNIGVTYSGKQSEKISPLCGCDDVGEWENWRGITFTARDVQLDRKGDLPVTGYVVFPPYPEATSIYPIHGGLMMWVKYFAIEINEGETFSPRNLILQELPINYHQLSAGTEKEEGFAEIFTKGSLHISLLGEKPLGSWIPMENSDVSISYKLNQNLTETESATIREKYLESTEEELQKVFKDRGTYQAYDQAEMSMPLGDFLGPNIVVWAEGESATVLASSQLLDTPRDVVPGKKVIRAMLINPPFAVRIVAIPFRADTISEVASGPPERTEDYSPLTSQGRFDNGEMTLTISKPNTQAKEIDTIYQSIAQNPTTISDFKTYFSNEIGGGKMEFRYPPIPPNKSFNVFGPVTELKTDAAVGNFLIGSRSFNIETPADVEFKDIKEMSVKNGVMEIPIQIGMEDEPSKIQLKANSEIYVNGESVTRRIDNNKSLLDYVVLFTTILGVLLTIVSTALATKDSLGGRKSYLGNPG